MDNDMSQKSRQEVLAKMRRSYLKAGPQYKAKLLDQVVVLFGYHRKSAIRALRVPDTPARPQVPTIIGRPREYSPPVLLPVLKPIWFASYQPCGRRLHSLLPEWLPAYEADHRRLNSDIRQALLEASPRTLDCLLAPLRAQSARRGGHATGQFAAPKYSHPGPMDRRGPRVDGTGY